MDVEENMAEDVLLMPPLKRPEQATKELVSRSRKEELIAGLKSALPASPQFRYHMLVIILC